MIKLVEALRLIEQHRHNAVVVACQESRQAWAQVSNAPALDIPYAGCMGKGASLGLGIALARPDRRVVVLDGDGSLLMNLGCLATVAGKAPRNLYHFVIENGIYAGTGGQPIPNQGQLSFAEMARAAGYASCHTFDDLEEFSVHVRSVLNAKGPVFVCLKVEPVPETLPMGLRPRGPRIREGIESVRAALVTH